MKNQITTLTEQNSGLMKHMLSDTSTQPGPTTYPAQAPANPVLD